MSRVNTQCRFSAGVSVFGALGCALLLALAVGPQAGSQTPYLTLDGQNAGDRSGTCVGYATRYVYIGLLACSIEPIIVTGAPGYSSAKGRVELWLPPSASQPGAALAGFGEGSQPGDEYGHAFSAAGNLNGVGSSDIVVGAPGATGYVAAYDSNQCQWPYLPLAAFWTVTNSSYGERFGHAVAIIGDVNGDGNDDVAVGAPEHLAVPLPPLLPKPGAGKVVILSGIDGSVIRTHRGTTVDGNLGWAVAGLGDLDGDGVREYAAGEPGHDVPGMNEAGRTRVFSGATGFQIPALTTVGTQANAHHGWSVAHAGDVNRDGTPDYITGAPHFNGGSSSFPIYNVGRAQVVSGADGSVLLQVTGNGPFANAGESVAGGQDLNNDTFPEVLVGHPGSNASAGRVQVWSGRTLGILYEVHGASGEELGTHVAVQDHPTSGTNWLAGRPGAIGNTGGVSIWEGKVNWNVQAPFTYWGSSVGLLDDVDGDSWDDFAVSQYDTSVNFVAPIWEVRSGKTSGVLHQGSSGAASGYTVAGLGDLTGDGIGEIAVGKPAEGEVTIFSGANPTTVVHSHITGPGSLYGHVVADAGLIDGDSIRDYLVTAPQGGSFFPNPPMANAGQVYVYSGATGSVIRTHGGGAPGDQLGRSAAGVGDVDNDGRDDYAAGAPSHGSAFSLGIGQARIWSGVDGSLIMQLNGPASSPGTQTGYSICGPGDLDGDGHDDVIIGEPFFSPGYPVISALGRFRVFAGAPQGMPLQVLHTETGLYNFNLGYALAPVGDVNRDGVNDYAVSAPMVTGATSVPPEVSVYSGSSHQKILSRYEWTPGGFPVPTSAEFGTALAGRRDPHTDQRQELVIGNPSSNPGSGSVLVLMMPAARAHEHLDGCGGTGPNGPRALWSPPILGELMEIRYEDLPPGPNVYHLYSSAYTLTGTSLGSGCTLGLDLATAGYLLSIPYQGTISSFQTFIPETWSLLGMRLNLQSIIADGSAPLGFALTNTSLLTFGF